MGSITPRDRMERLITKRYIADLTLVKRIGKISLHPTAPLNAWTVAIASEIIDARNEGSEVPPLEDCLSIRGILATYLGEGLLPNAPEGVEADLAKLATTLAAGSDTITLLLESLDKPGSPVRMIEKLPRLDGKLISALSETGKARLATYRNY